MPSPVEALPCGSRSITRVRKPSSARQAPRLTVVVVLPTPPFWLAMAITRGSGRPGRLRSTLGSGLRRSVGRRATVRIRPAGRCRIGGRVRRHGVRLSEGTPGDGADAAGCCGSCYQPSSAWSRDVPRGTCDLRSRGAGRCSTWNIAPQPVSPAEVRACPTEPRPPRSNRVRRAARRRHVGRLRRRRADQDRPASGRRIAAAARSVTGSGSEAPRRHQVDRTEAEPRDRLDVDLVHRHPSARPEAVTP